MKNKQGPLRGLPVCLLGFMAMLLLDSFAAATPQDFSNLSVVQVVTGWGSEGIYLGTSNTAKSIDGCGPAFFMATGNPLLNQNFAIALAAFSTGNMVQIHVDGCLDSNNMKMTGIRVVK